MTIPLERIAIVLVVLLATLLLMLSRLRTGMARARGQEPASCALAFMTIGSRVAAISEHFLVLRPCEAAANRYAQYSKIRYSILAPAEPLLLVAICST